MDDEHTILISWGKTFLKAIVFQTNDIICSRERHSTFLSMIYTCIHLPVIIYHSSEWRISHQKYLIIFRYVRAFNDKSTDHREGT